MSSTVIFDFDVGLMGLYLVKQRKYLPHFRADYQIAVRRLLNADKVITFNGWHRDLPDLAPFLGQATDERSPLADRHIDMMDEAWYAHSDFFGRGLTKIYHMACGPVRCRRDENRHTYKNRCDVYMTRKIWELWESKALAPVRPLPPEKLK
jgi:hypothetical protein